jgi:hypothetical protein
MTRTVRAGWCDGGPYAGRQLAHDGGSFLVLFLNEEVCAECGQPLPPRVGAYEWDDGAWRWREPETTDDHGLRRHP